MHESTTAISLSIINITTLSMMHINTDLEIEATITKEQQQIIICQHMLII